MDIIHIRDLALRCIVGVFPEERKDRQDVLINVTLECDFGTSAQTDDLDDTVNYKAISKRIIARVEASEFKLIETMAEHIAVTCFESPGVTRARITVDKPGALRFARSVAVEIVRDRPA